MSSSITEWTAAYDRYVEYLRRDVSARRGSVVETPVAEVQGTFTLPPCRGRCLVRGAADASGLPYEVHVVSDIDGCLNIEDLPEKERWRSVGPAREAFAPVQAHGVMVSLMSSRSLPEIDLYRNAAAVHGFAIGEDGGVIQLPEQFDSPTIEAIVTAGFRVEALGEMTVVNLSAIGTRAMRNILQEIAEESGQPAISSLTSTAVELMEASGHETLAHAAASMVRVSSAYAKHLTAQQAQLLHQKCSVLGIRVMDCPWDSTHCLFGVTPNGESVNKGDALRALDRIIAIAHHVAGMRPVVIGNGTNDLPLMRIAVELGGQAIVIPRPDGSYALPIDEVPPDTFRASTAAGAGIAEVLPYAVALAEGIPSSGAARMPI